MNDEINAVDMAFVVDTTGSMGGLISSAQRQMVQMIEAVTKAAAINLRLAVVEYRDHPPQDNTFVYQLHNFSADLEKTQKVIMGLKAHGGGDAQEAVLDGVLAALELDWRPHSRRIAVLVGDASPHGSMQPDGSFKSSCHCNQTIESVTASAEALRMPVYSLGLNNDATEPFKLISKLSGGEFFDAKQADKAIETIAEILKAEFNEIEFDRKVWAAWYENRAASNEELANLLGSDWHKVTNSLIRLHSRGLLEVSSGLQIAAVN